jgi:hypothetical protein
VQTFRICGEKEDIYKVLKEARDMGHEFADTPIIKYVHHGQWTVLLNIKVPVEVGCNDRKYEKINSKNKDANDKTI